MKKLLVIVLALCLVMMSMVPAFAADAQVAVVATVDEVTPQSNAEKFYDAIKDIEAAYAGSDIKALEDALENLSVLTENMGGLTDKDYEELKVLMGVSDDEEVVDIILTVIFDAASVLGVKEMRDEFVNDPSYTTAFDFVEVYDSIYNDPEYVDEDLRAAVKRLLPDIDEVYADALTQLPSDKVMNLYYAYDEVAFAWDLEELEPATKKLYEALIAAEDLTDEEKEQLGELLYMPYEDAYQEIFFMYVNANVVLETADVYDAFVADKNKENAQALVDKYEAIFMDESYEDEYLRSMIYDYIFDIDEVYEEALDVLKSQPQKPQEGGESKKDEEKSTQANTAAVKTGDFVPMYLYSFALLSLVAVCSFVCFRKRVK
ncbi:MAG: hypothetical protein IJD68_00815 [Ruminococcus sp.]|nr:hypothetical protein [Ruminococcus sp.]